MKNLVIVESPTKARTLSKYLGSDYRVEASMGHIRDLPKSELGIDTENNFEPKYVVPRDKVKKVNELKKIAKTAENLWLATDPDREGEAIAWHLQYLLTESKGMAKIPTSRVAFHEITESAIKEAFEDPREVDLRLVDAQQARRVLDRIVGYKLSPLLWRKVKSGLSAGRVQSVALRLIVEREAEVNAFKAVEYWSIEADLKSGAGHFIANLIEKDGKKLVINNQIEANNHVKALEAAEYKISRIAKKEVRKFPAPPFTTSTLQQTSSNRLGMSAKKTMMIAQTLYEHGLITYMRTDSVNLSTQAISQARSYIETNFGKNYVPQSARVYKTKSKVAQEAHEAIRPTNINVTGETLKTSEGMTRDYIRVYELIWKRMMASQMSEAVMDQTSVDVTAASSYLFRATGSTIKFDGWLKVFGKVIEEEEEGEKDSQSLPELKENESLSLLTLLPNQHFTEPPPRFNEASLIKKLEELGIGRPSTYAPILSTIQDRYYVEKREKKFFPTELGITVNNFLMKYFPDIFDYTFTAEMEDNLDSIATGEKQWKPIISSFYKPFAEKLEKVEGEAERVKVIAEETDKDCPECGKKLVIKFGKFGKFLACSGFPDCKHTESYEQAVDAICPDCGGEIVMRKTKKGRPFYGCRNWPNCKFASWTKPKKADS
ncbi:MAG: type I DNA topoisomerase [Candidatus Daviesbacteria bacterium]|nr:type I DNA topoisomerase [Candidatus Daviesbacteria bacterium]